MPDGPERVEDIGARDLRNRLLTQRREGVARQTREPIAAVLGMAPAGLQLGPDPFGGLGRRWAFLGTAFLGERVPAGAGGPAVGAGLLERDDWEAADAEFAAADGDSLNPAAAAGGLNVRIQAGVVAWGLHTPLRVRGMRSITPDALPPQSVVVLK